MYAGKHTAKAKLVEAGVVPRHTKPPRVCKSTCVWMLPIPPSHGCELLSRKPRKPERRQEAPIGEHVCSVFAVCTAAAWKGEWALPLLRPAFQINMRMALRVDAWPPTFQACVRAATKEREQDSIEFLRTSVFHMVEIGADTTQAGDSTNCA